MANTEELLNQARALGEAIANHAHVRAYREAQEAVDADAETRQLMEDYAAQVQRIQQLESERKPIEVEDKHKLEEFRSKMAGNELVKKMTAAQVDFVSLMNQINLAIEGPLSGGKNRETGG